MWAGDVCVAMGRLDAAVDYCAIDERNALLLRMSTSLEYDTLRGPRFNELLRRVNLPVR
jgi:hypothetical protein